MIDNQMLHRFTQHKEIFPENHIGLPGIKEFDYDIIIDPAAKPIYQKIQKNSDLEKDTINKHIDAMDEAGIISPCKSPWGFWERTSTQSRWNS
jgi:hypothetical protein